MSTQTAADPDLLRMLDEEAMRYSERLTDENLMEAFAQGKQRKITLESFDLVARSRPEVQCFNEMLIQYPRRGKGVRPGQVVPDNFVVLHPEPLAVVGHYSLHVQPARPFLAIEYVSKSNTRKDYEVNFRRYEADIRVPYYLLFYPDNEELTLFRLDGNRYATVGPITTGRRPIPELELEIALLDGWVRYWFRGELLPLPAELADQRDAADARAAAERAGRLAAEAELARLRDELARLRGGG